MLMMMMAISMRMIMMQIYSFAFCAIILLINYKWISGLFELSLSIWHNKVPQIRTEVYEI